MAAMTRCSAGTTYRRYGGYGGGGFNANKYNTINGRKGNLARVPRITHTNTFVDHQGRERNDEEATPATTPRGALLVACAKKKKDVRLVVTLECTEAKEEGATPSRYTTQKVRNQ